MIELPNSNALEWWILGCVFGFLQAEDSTPEGVMPRDRDPLTALPLDLAPRAISVPDRAFLGENGQMQVVPGGLRMTPGSKILPRHMARGGLALAGEMLLWSGGDSPGGGPGNPGLAADFLCRIENGRKRRLSMIPKREWTDEETNTWRELAYRIRKVFLLWAQMGLVDANPTLYETAELPGLDGLPRVVRPYWKLIEIARQKIPGTRWANRPKSILHDLTAEERLTQPAYAQASYAAETGGSVAAPLVDPAPAPEPPPAAPETPKPTNGGDA